MFSIRLGVANENRNDDDDDGNDNDDGNNDDDDGNDDDDKMTLLGAAHTLRRVLSMHQVKRENILILTTSYYHWPVPSQIRK